MADSDSQSPMHCNGAAIRKASRRITQMYDDALGPCGIRSTQFTILCAIRDGFKSPPTIRRLADALAMEASALGHNLKPLERVGWVVLQPSEDDRRRKHLILTPDGLAQLKAAESFWRTAQARFESVVGSSAAADLRNLLLGIAHDDRLTAADL